ncbi:hypothetical protein LMG29542_08366 [Paraburkholderia humisilvae]|uniref:Uncharacterized protein n=1 Tax=Paraburkholderia humisilvae TaxID=627669 RepID=A0A6J5F924_9BURK|nr:hypothetical protein LMG29542_08366 [Paraburkholderia humisilvae]
MIAEELYEVWRTSPRLNRHRGFVNLPNSETAKGADTATGQKAVDEFWANPAKSRHATNRAASCLR